MLCKRATYRLDFRIEKQKKKWVSPVCLQQSGLPELVAIYSSGWNFRYFKLDHFFFLRQSLNAYYQKILDETSLVNTETCEMSIAVLVEISQMQRSKVSCPLRFSSPKYSAEVWSVL